jgi:hypothetical protein
MVGIELKLLKKRLLQEFREPKDIENLNMESLKERIEH